MKPKDVPFLVYDSFRALVMDLVHMFKTLKKASTWSFILYATFFVGAYYRNYTVMKIALPLMIVVYILRRRVEPEFTESLKERAFLKNKEIEIREYYERYKTRCKFSRVQPLEFEDYKQEELKKIQSRKQSELMEEESE